jgi:pimeloyl-ACP methyl ester carboxylesterase
MKMKSIFKNEEGRLALMQFYDGMLSFWPVAHIEQDIDTRFGSTHVVTAGDPDLPPCVLLHGAASNAVTWIADVLPLSQHFHVIAPDLPGEVGKSAPFRPSWKDNSYARWLEDVLNVLNVEKAVFVGLSLGGWAALKFAARFPQRVGRMALLAPGGIVHARWKAIIKPILYSLSKSSGGSKMQRMVFGEGDVASELKIFFSLIHQAYIPRFGSPPLLSISRLRNVACPALVLAAGRDAFFSAEKAGRRLDGLEQYLFESVDSQHGLVGMGEKILPFLLGQE